MIKTFLKQNKFFLTIVILAILFFLLSYSNLKASQGEENQAFINSLAAKDSEYWIYNNFDWTIIDANRRSTSESAVVGRRRYASDVANFNAYIPDITGSYVCAIAFSQANTLNIETTKLNNQLSDWSFTSSGYSVVAWENPAEGYRQVQLKFTQYQDGSFAYYKCDFIPEIQANHFIGASVVSNLAWGTDYNQTVSSVAYRHSWWQYNYPNLETNPTHLMLFGGLITPNTNDLWNPVGEVLEIWSNNPLKYKSFSRSAGDTVSGLWLLDLKGKTSSFVHNLGFISNSQSWSNWHYLFWGFSNHFEIYLNIDEGEDFGDASPSEVLRPNVFAPFPHYHSISAGQHKYISFQYNLNDYVSCAGNCPIWNNYNLELVLYSQELEKEVATIPLSTSVGSAALAVDKADMIAGINWLVAYIRDIDASSIVPNSIWFDEETGYLYYDDGLGVPDFLKYTGLAVNQKTIGQPLHLEFSFNLAHTYYSDSAYQEYEGIPFIIDLWNVDDNHFVKSSWPLSSINQKNYVSYFQNQQLVNFKAKLRVYDLVNEEYLDIDSEPFYIIYNYPDFSFFDIDIVSVQNPVIIFEPFWDETYPIPVQFNFCPDESLNFNLDDYFIKIEDDLMGHKVPIASSTPLSTCQGIIAIDYQFGSVGSVNSYNLALYDDFGYLVYRSDRVFKVEVVDKLSSFFPGIDFSNIRSIYDQADFFGSALASSYPVWFRPIVWVFENLMSFFQSIIRLIFSPLQQVFPFNFVIVFYDAWQEASISSTLPSQLAYFNSIVDSQGNMYLIIPEEWSGDDTQKQIAIWGNDIFKRNEASINFFNFIRAISTYFLWFLFFMSIVVMINHVYKKIVED